MCSGLATSLVDLFFSPILVSLTIDDVDEANSVNIDWQNPALETIGQYCFMDVQSKYTASAYSLHWAQYSTHCSCYFPLYWYLLQELFHSSLLTSPLKMTAFSLRDSTKNLSVKFLVSVQALLHHHQMLTFWKL